VDRAAETVERRLVAVQAATAARDRAIVEALDTGLSLGGVAGYVGISRARVHQIRNREVSRTPPDAA
jgi:hypothetical protein